MRFMGKSIYLLGVLFILWSCGNNRNEVQEPADFIPPTAETVVKIKRLETSVEDYARNPFLKQLKSEPFGAFFERYKPFLSSLHAKDEILFCLSHIDHTEEYTFIGNQKSFSFTTDSIAEVQNSTLQIQNHSVRKSEVGQNELFSAIIDSILIVSTSDQVLSEILNKSKKDNAAFQKAFKVKNDKELTYVRSMAKPLNDTTGLSWGNQATFELQLLPDGLVAHGVVLDNDTLNYKIAVSRQQQPQKTDAPRIIPVTAQRALSFSFSNAEVLEKNLNIIRKDSMGVDPIFETANELIQLELNGEFAMAVKSLDIGLSWDHLARYVTETNSYREVKVFALSEENTFFTPFKPIFKEHDYAWVFEWEEFIFFTQTSGQAESLITSLLNETVLDKTPLYESTATYLAQSSSLVFYEMKGNISGVTASLLNVEESRIQSFPLAITQLIYDRNFAHLNIIAKQTSAKVSTQGMVQQLAVIPLENTVMLPPKFFTNHNTMGKDIVVQDVSNQLYFISSNGKILWKKILDGPILGDVHEVDLLRNGKKQLAFSTKNNLYVLDRNGNSVSPFPKTFKDPITQPVSIFDYDNNRKYRFVIVQKNELFMYDNQGKIVDGFTFKKASSPIALPPQHIRIGDKDYILIAEENGKLNILSRVGKERIKVNKTFDFSEIPIEKEGSDFVIITNDNNKISIAQNGKTTTLTLQTSKNYWFTILGNTKVTLDDNLLRINGKLTELPLGIYSKPKLFSLRNQIYIAVTEVNENKVFVYNKSGELLPNFPVYGTSEVDLSDANNNKKLNIIVKGQPKELILYQAN